MSPHVCPWWGGYFIDNRLRRLIHKPEEILAPYVKTGQTTLDFGCGMGMFAIASAPDQLSARLAQTSSLSLRAKT